MDYFCERQTSGLYRFNQEWLFNNRKEKTLDLAFKNPSDIKIIRKNSNSLVVEAVNDTEVNGIKLEKNTQYNLNVGVFGQIAGEEYFLNKDLVGYLPNKQAELVAKLANVIKTNS